MAGELEIAKGVKTTTNVPVDAWYGPYASVADACTAVPVSMRQYRTVGIIEAGIVEYSWKSGTADSDLVKKQNAGIVDTTWTALKALKDSQALTPGQSYRFAFTTIHRIQGTTVINNGTPENLIIRALDKSRFEREAFSELYPQDTITYDFNNALAEDGVTTRPGWITMRHDTTKNIKAWYDWRNVKYRVWKTSLYHHPVVKTSESLASATIVYGTVDAAPTQYREYYINFSTFTTHNANPQLSLTKSTKTVTREIVKVSGASLVANEINTLLGTYKYARVYYSPTFDKYVIVDNQAETQMCEWYMGLQATDFTIGNGTRITVPNANDFQDVLTFASATPNAHDVTIGRRTDGTPNRIIWLTNGATNLCEFYEDSYDVVFATGNTDKVIVDHSMRNCRFSGAFQYCRVGNESWNILALNGVGGRMSWATGTRASDAWCQDVTIFASNNLFESSFQIVTATTFRFFGYTRNFHVEGVQSCILNLAAVQTVNIIGLFINKCFEGQALLGNTLWFGSEGDAVTYPDATNWQYAVIASGFKISKNNTKELKIPALKDDLNRMVTIRFDAQLSGTSNTFTLLTISEGYRPVDNDYTKYVLTNVAGTYTPAILTISKTTGDVTLTYDQAVTDPVVKIFETFNPFTGV